VLESAGNCLESPHINSSAVVVNSNTLFYKVESTKANTRETSKKIVKKSILFLPIIRI